MHDWYRKATTYIFWPTGPGLAVCSAKAMHAIWAQAFPLFMKQMEGMLLSGELEPRRAKGITLQAKELTCEADTLGSCGYVYIAIYPTPVPVPATQD